MQLSSNQGSRPAAVQSVARAYGFQRTITTRQLARLHGPSMVPFAQQLEGGCAGWGGAGWGRSGREKSWQEAGRRPGSSGLGVRRGAGRAGA